MRKKGAEDVDKGFSFTSVHSSPQLFKRSIYGCQTLAYGVFRFYLMLANLSLLKYRRQSSNSRNSDDIKLSCNS